MAIDIDPSASILVQIEYQIDPQRQTEFLSALQRLGEVRRRNGAMHWSVYADSARRGHYVELFAEPDWEQHLRHHARVTVADAALQAEVNVFHTASLAPDVRHFVSLPRNSIEPGV